VHRGGEVAGPLAPGELLVEDRGPGMEGRADAHRKTPGGSFDGVEYARGAPTATAGAEELPDLKSTARWPGFPPPLTMRAASEAWLGDPPARRNVHAARRRLPLARERPRKDDARAPPVVEERRGGLRGVRPAHGRHGALHQADPLGRSAGPRHGSPDAMAAARRARQEVPRPPGDGS